MGLHVNDYDDPDFCRLVQREILEGDEKRLELVAKEVFQNMFQGISELCRAAKRNTMILKLSRIMLQPCCCTDSGIRGLCDPYGRCERGRGNYAVYTFTCQLRTKNHIIPQKIFELILLGWSEFSKLKTLLFHAPLSAVAIQVFFPAPAQDKRKIGQYDIAMKQGI